MQNAALLGVSGREKLMKKEPEMKTPGSEPEGLKQRIIEFCIQQGADLVGFASVDRWDKEGSVPPEFRPKALFPAAETVIVLGIGMPLPIVETTPSILHKELYDTSNIELDQIAFRLVRFLNKLGYPSSYFTRDGYGSLKLLKKRMAAAFGHVKAGYFAGLGTIGLSNNLLTPEFGSRVRLISVFTSARLEPSPMIENELCIKCLACVKCCPKRAIKPREDRIIADLDKIACTEMAQELTRRRCYPCGICTKVCPIGADRKLYKQKGIMKKYLQESEALAADPDDPAYRTWTHVRKYGAWQEDESKEDD